MGFGIDAPGADVAPEVLEMTAQGFTATVRTPRGSLRIESPLRGRFNVENVLGVVAMGEILGLDHTAVARGIASVRGVPGRLEPIDMGQPFQVLVDYAHTPDSLENVLRTTRDLAGEGRLIVLFGCGGDRDTGKRPQMGAIGRALSDVCIVTSDNPRSEDPNAIIRQIVATARWRVRCLAPGRPHEDCAAGHHRVGRHHAGGGRRRRDGGECNRRLA
jgi:UDP-N-acetylmuramoyl-L-alanyl-D-glutamate--2,6-diaminopimelate ligase